MGLILAAAAAAAQQPSSSSSAAAVAAAAAQQRQEACRDATDHQSQFAAALSDESEALLLIYGPVDGLSIYGSHPHLTLIQ